MLTNLEIDYLDHSIETTKLLAKWLYQQWGINNPNDSIDRRVQALKKVQGSRQIPMTLIAKLDNQLAGTASLVDCDMSIRKQYAPWMASVLVHPEFRRKGIASKICNRIVEEARRLGHSQAYLFTPDQERLYARLGWKKIEEVSYSHHGNVAVMKIVL